MKIVIVGFGRVGKRTARILQREGHEVVVVERDATKAERARDEEFIVVEGDGGHTETLEQAGLDNADAVAGVTGDLNTNYSVCVVGETHGCRTVLRVSEEVSDELYEKYADDVDEIIYPERVGAAGAKTALLGGDFNVLADLTESLSIASVVVPDGSPAVGKRVVELDLPGEARIYAHGRDGEAMTIPLPQTTIEAGDSVAVMADTDVLDSVRAQLRGEGAPA
ncbi:potassium channel family protein [Salinibaculum rarum]|uniref:potassium channel family protein n=1 Tax=Salinibaculum rarum TaxID=3058903 RepID=UPI0026605528|nr:TrkA family potassium uptake protein [Salinibaculum sp. KK48]